MKLCTSYQVQCRQTVFCFEIRFFAKRQNVSCNPMTTKQNGQTDEILEDKNNLTQKI